jgi:hypothetical protein
MVSEEPRPRQKDAILAQKHIVTLRIARPDITIDIRWWTSHKGVPENEKADEWVKLAAESPDAQGVEALQRSFVHLMREILEMKWTEVLQ